MNITQLDAALKDRRSTLERKKGRLEQLEQDLHGLRLSAEEQNVALEELTQALQVLGLLEGAWGKTFEERLAGMISRGLTAVFHEPLRFVLENKRSGDLSAMDFKLVQRFGDEELSTDILGAKGGGVVAVVSFLLRVLILMASKPPLRPVLLLDESFAMVSQEYIPGLAQLLRQLVDETGLQIVLVTHEPMLGEHADITYEVTQRNGQSEFRQVKTVAERVAR